MDLLRLVVSQRGLRRVEQIPLLVLAVRAGDSLPPILLSEEGEDVQIEDGHHRATGYLLAGRVALRPEEYVLIPRGRQRARFGRLLNLAARCGLV